MKFICPKNILEKILSIVERFTGKNINLPILSNILLESLNDNLVITATNLEHAIQIKLKGKTLKEGKICIPGKTISSIIQAIKEDSINLEEKQNNLIIKTSSKEVRLNGLPIEDFPIIPSIKKTISFKIDALVLKESLERVLPSVANSDFKPEFNGVLFDLNKEYLKLVATDTFRLAENKINYDIKNKDESVSFILPNNIAQELTRIINENGDLIISLGDNQIIFEIGDIRIISRLIDGSFPEYSGIIPKNFEAQVYANRIELKDIIKASGIFASKLMDVTFEFEEKGIKITSSNSEIGEYKTFMPAKISFNTNKPIKISFNYRYFLDGINALDEEEIYLGCNTENKPSILHNKSNKNFFYVLMPIKIN